MDLTANNAATMAELVQAFAAGGVLALVGAGSSVRLGYPTWTGLIDALKGRAAAESGVDAVGPYDRQSDAYVRAGVYRRLMTRATYEEYMKETFGPRSPVFDRFHVDLVTLPFRHVLTTNYDPALDNAHAHAFGAPPTVVDAKDSADVAAFVDASGFTAPCGVRYYVHLHGRYDAPGTLILTEADFVERYEREAWAPLALTSLLAVQRFLAVGYSLADVDVLRLFRTVRAKLHQGRPRHFAVLPLDDPDMAVSERERLLEKFGIAPIFYRRTPDHAGLVSFLRALDDVLRHAYPRLFEPREVQYVHSLPASHRLLGREEPLALLAEHSPARIQA